MFEREEAYIGNGESSEGYILGNVPKYYTPRRDTHYLCKDFEGQWWRGNKDDSSEGVVNLGNVPFCKIPRRDTLYSCDSHCETFFEDRGSHGNNEESSGGLANLGKVLSCKAPWRDTHYSRGVKGGSFFKDRLGHGNNGEGSGGLGNLGNVPSCSIPWQNTHYSRDELDPQSFYSQMCQENNGDSPGDTANLRNAPGCSAPRRDTHYSHGTGEESFSLFVSKDSQCAILDSGATHTISTIREDFCKIAPRPTVSLTAVDGKVANGECVGYIGTLKSNNLGLKSAIYIPDISIGRLLSTSQLLEAGWEVVLRAGRGESHLKSQISGEIFPVSSTGGLPRVDWRFDSPSTDAAVFAVTGRKANTKLLEHRRGGHLSQPSLRVQCPDCIVAKGGKTGAAELRSPSYCNTVPLQQLNMDFYGPLEKSIRDFRVLLVVICDAISYVWMIPLKQRSECVEEVRKLISSVRATDSKTVGEKVVHVVRTDNDTVFRSREWGLMLEKLCVSEVHSVPYTPQMNGCVERFMRTLGEALRANLNGVDKRLYCYAAQYIAWAWNRTPRTTYSRSPEYNGCTPFEARRRRTEGTTPGSLHATMTSAVDEKAERWDPIKRRFGCLAFILIQPREKVAKLQPKWRKAVFLGYSEKNSAWIFGCYTEDSRTRGGLRWAEYETRDAKFLEESLVSDVNTLKPRTNGVMIQEDALLELSERIGVGEIAPSLQRLPGNGEERKRPLEGPRRVGEKRRLEVPGPDGEERKAPLEVPGKGSKRVKTSHTYTSLVQDDSLVGDEELLEVEVRLSVAEALRSEDAPSWITALQREKTKLEAAGTWREPTEEELATNKKVVPVAILLTKKRDGTFKARACVLGNLVNTDGLNVYAPVVTMAGHRYFLTSAAAQGHHIKCFDIDCAFLNAPLKEEVYIKLPKVWQEQNKTDVRRLIKALYGLPQSPRAWFKRYEGHLRQLGWTQCEHELGLWKRESKLSPGSYLQLSVYVDDNFISGKVDSEVEESMREILREFPGKVIHPKETEDGWLVWDALGADFRYRPKKKEMVISMQTYIEKVSKKFDVFKAASSPSFQVCDLQNTSEESDFKYRELVGALQWMCTIARPDVARPVNILAQHLSDKVTKGMEACARRVLRYLFGTRELGVSYAPIREKGFKAEYLRDLGEDCGEFPLFHTFADASFASCSKSKNSTTGAVIFYRSCPIVWRSKRQTVRAYSTMESEWIAASDSLAMATEVGFLGFYDKDPHCAKSETGLPGLMWLWCDNQSTIVTAKSEEINPKSRHFALRYMRVRDECERLKFCKTDLQRADGLTKNAVTGKSRNMLLGRKV